MRLVASPRNSIPFAVSHQIDRRCSRCRRQSRQQTNCPKKKIHKNVEKRRDGIRKVKTRRVMKFKLATDYRAISGR